MTNASHPIRIIVVRTDNIGDVILSTPVFEVLKKHYPESRLTALVRAPIAPLLRGLPSVDDVLIYDPVRRHSGIKGFFRLVSDIRAGRNKIALVLQSNRKIGSALFAAGVRYRIGPLSKPHSYFLYNRGIRQRRSEVEMHEADYNLQLLRRLGIRVGARTVSPRIMLNESSREAAGNWLKTNGWSGKPLVIVHPGMRESALNWPTLFYQELVRLLLIQNREVLLTAGPAEQHIIKEFSQWLDLNKGNTTKIKPIFYGGEAASSIDLMAGLYSFATVVVAPSTGPLHIAAALGRRVVTFYPPIRVQSAMRWGPYVADDSRATVLVPEGYCGEDFTCRGKLCNYHPCMKSITVEQAIEAVDLQLRAAKKNGETNVI